MRRPVRTPDGAVYEAATVERWLSEQGSIDPLTGAHLTKDMLEPCKELKRRLEKWHLTQAMQKGAAADKDASLRARLAEVQAPENAGRLNDHLFVQRTDE